MLINEWQCPTIKPITFLALDCIWLRSTTKLKLIILYVIFHKATVWYNYLVYGCPYSTFQFCSSQPKCSKTIFFYICSHSQQKSDFQNSRTDRMSLGFVSTRCYKKQTKCFQMSIWTTFVLPWESKTYENYLMESNKLLWVLIPYTCLHIIIIFSDKKYH